MDQRNDRPHLRPTNDSWRVDGKLSRREGKYLYRAVDSQGKTLDFCSCSRDAQAAKRFSAGFEGSSQSEPRVINLDKNAAYSKAIDELKAKKSCPSRWSYDRISI